MIAHRSAWSPFLPMPSDNTALEINGLRNLPCISCRRGPFALFPLRLLNVMWPTLTLEKPQARVRGKSFPLQPRFAFQRLRQNPQTIADSSFSLHPHI